MVIDHYDSLHTFNRFEEESHVEINKCHFRLIDLTRGRLYDVATPAINEE